MRKDNCRLVFFFVTLRKSYCVQLNISFNHHHRKKVTWSLQIIRYGRKWANGREWPCQGAKKEEVTVTSAVHNITSSSPSWCPLSKTYFGRRWLAWNNQLPPPINYNKRDSLPFLSLSLTTLVRERNSSALFFRFTRLPSHWAGMTSMMMTSMMMMREEREEEKKWKGWKRKRRESKERQKEELKSVVSWN